MGTKDNKECVPPTVPWTGEMTVGITFDMPQSRPLTTRKERGCVPVSKLRAPPKAQRRKRAFAFGALPCTCKCSPHCHKTGKCRNYKFQKSLPAVVAWETVWCQPGSKSRHPQSESAFPWDTASEATTWQKDLAD